MDDGRRTTDDGTMVTLFAVALPPQTLCFRSKTSIPDIDANDIGAATIVLATCNRLYSYRLALPTSNRPSHRRCNHQINTTPLSKRSSPPPTRGDDGRTI